MIDVQTDSAADKLNYLLQMLFFRGNGWVKDINLF